MKTFNQHLTEALTAMKSDFGSFYHPACWEIKARDDRDHGHTVFADPVKISGSKRCARCGKTINEFDGRTAGR